VHCCRHCNAAVSALLVALCRHCPALNIVLPASERVFGTCAQKPLSLLLVSCRHCPALDIVLPASERVFGTCTDAAQCCALLLLRLIQHQRHLCNCHCQSAGTARRLTLCSQPASVCLAPAQMLRSLITTSNAVLPTWTAAYMYCCSHSNCCCLCCFNCAGTVQLLI
jgi:hypothetical protein